MERSAHLSYDRIKVRTTLDMEVCLRSYRNEELEVQIWLLTETFSSLQGPGKATGTGKTMKKTATGSLLAHLGEKDALAMQKE